MTIKMIFRKIGKTYLMKQSRNTILSMQKEHDIIDEDAKTYEQYMNEGDLETFIQRYTSKNGDKIVAFGEYGYC